MLTKRDLHSILQATPVPCQIILPDAPKFTIAEVNDAHLKTTGTKRSDLIGKGAFEAFPENLII